MKYRTEETTVLFQGKPIVIRNHTPILSDKERDRRKREIDQRLYDVVMRQKAAQG